MYVWALCLNTYQQEWAVFSLVNHPEIVGLGAQDGCLRTQIQMYQVITKKNLATH